MRPRPDRRASGLSAKPVLLLIAGCVAAFALADSVAEARGVSLSAPGRVPRTHDSDIGSKGTGDPATDYVLNCQGCHQVGGVGLPGAVPRLEGSVAVLASKPGGREYLARVPGVAQAQLDDEATAALLNWLLVYFDAEHLPEDFRPFTAEEIAPLRKRPLVRASEFRATLLQTE